MSRPYVPHCRKCKDFKIYENNTHWYMEGRKYYKCDKCNKYVNYQEAKTSPQWCPRRLTYSKINKGY